jgi:hypothetical protein
VKNLKRLSLSLVFLLFVLVPVMAQDVPAEPTNQVVDVVSGEGTTVIVEASETPAEPATPASFLSQILEFVMGAIVGAGLALGSAAAYIRAAMNDPVKMTLAETAARSISPESLKQVLDFLDTSRAFVVEATDGVPMITKQTPANTGFTSTMATPTAAPMP